MTCSFLNSFKSFLYSDTYLSQVDLSKNLSSFEANNCSSFNETTADVARGLISDEKVKDIFFKPLSYTKEEIEKKNAILRDLKFELMSEKDVPESSEPVPFYSVVKHPDLPGWIIKAGASRIPEEGGRVFARENDIGERAFFTKEDSLLRVAMAKRMQTMVKEAGLENDVVIPRKILIARTGSENEKDPTRKYCVICEEIKDVLSAEDTFTKIGKMSSEKQKEIAKKISVIVQKTGLVDATFNNIRLNKEGKLVFIDTEPAGLMVAKQSGVWNRLFGAKGAGVERCARIGLHNLLNESSQSPELQAFHDQLGEDYEKMAPKLSKWKVTLSVLSLGLFPLVNIVPLVKERLSGKIYDLIQGLAKMKKNYENKYIFHFKIAKG